jgi:hypothetical protein
LIATIASPTRIEGGRLVRDISAVYIGEEMSQERMTSTVQARDARGRWKFIYGTAIGVMRASFGWLSYADDRVARWDAQPLALDIQCPVEWLACPASGGRPCPRCERALVVLQHIGAAGDVVGLLQLIDRKPLPPATCQDPCRSSDSPDIARLRRLDERIRLWRPRRTPLARVSSLYRSRDDCLREHPGRAAGMGTR